VVRVLLPAAEVDVVLVTTSTGIQEILILSKELLIRFQLFIRTEDAAGITKYILSGIPYIIWSDMLDHNSPPDGNQLRLRRWKLTYSIPHQSVQLNLGDRLVLLRSVPEWSSLGSVVGILLSGEMRMHFMFVSNIKI